MINKDAALKWGGIFFVCGMKQKKEAFSLLPFGIVPSLACQRLTIFAILLATMYHLAALYT